MRKNPYIIGTGGVNIRQSACFMSCAMENDARITMTNEKRSLSRRKFIKGVIAASAAVASASYLFRAATVGQTGAPSDRLITINVNGQLRRPM
jgi:hypothetical protein